jgi:hypothetical protein
VPVLAVLPVPFIEPLISTDSADNSTESSLLDEAGNTGEAAIYAPGMKERCELQSTNVIIKIQCSPAT